MINLCYRGDVKAAPAYQVKASSLAPAALGMKRHLRPVLSALAEGNLDSVTELF